MAIASQQPITVIDQRVARHHWYPRGLILERGGRPNSWLRRDATRSQRDPTWPAAGLDLRRVDADRAALIFAGGLRPSDALAPLLQHDLAPHVATPARIASAGACWSGWVHPVARRPCSGPSAPDAALREVGLDGAAIRVVLRASRSGLATIFMTSPSRGEAKTLVQLRPAARRWTPVR